MKAAETKDIMAEFAQQQLSNIAEGEEAPTDLDYKNAVTKALRLAAGPDFQAERLYDEVTKTEKVPISPTIVERGEISQGMIQEINPWREIKPYPSSFSGVISALSSPITSVRQAQASPKYINIVYFNGSKGAPKGRGTQLD